MMVNQIAKGGLTGLGKRKKKKQNKQPLPHKTTNSVFEKTVGASCRVSSEVAAVGVALKVSLYQQQQTRQEAESTKLMPRVTQKQELPGHPSLDLKANVYKQGSG